jgi:hypothetical protein
MAGIQPASLPDPAVALDEPFIYSSQKIRGGDYSLKELAHMIHDLARSQGFAILGDPQFRLVNPISLREMLRLLQTFRPQPYASFREALQQ